MVTLTRQDQKRLERLAEQAGRTPKAMLRFVLRDGFDAVEQDVRETLEAERDMELNDTVPHEEVMRRARAIIEAALARRRNP